MYILGLAFPHSVYTELTLILVYPWLLVGWKHHKHTFSMYWGMRISGQVYSAPDLAQIPPWVLRKGVHPLPSKKGSCDGPPQEFCLSGGSGERVKSHLQPLALSILQVSLHLTAPSQPGRAQHRDTHPQEALASAPPLNSLGWKCIFGLTNPKPLSEHCQGCAETIT